MENFCFVATTNVSNATTSGDLWKQMGQAMVL